MAKKWIKKNSTKIEDNFWNFDQDPFLVMTIDSSINAFETIAFEIFWTEDASRSTFLGFTDG